MRLSSLRWQPRSMRSRWTARVAVAALLGTLMVVAAGPASAAPEGIRYVYDPAGRLIAAVEPGGVTAHWQYDAAGNIVSVTHTSSDTLSVLQLTPLAADPGESVTVIGTGFSDSEGAHQVRIGSTDAEVTAATPTALTITVPAGATTGPVTVTMANVSATSAQPLAVPVPRTTITSLTPDRGRPGDVVTIVGTNFDPVRERNDVVFNATRAVVLTATTTQLTVEVPPGAIAGPVRVETALGRSGALDFLIPNGADAPSAIVASAHIVAGQTATMEAPGPGVVLAMVDTEAGQSFRFTQAYGWTLIRPDGTTSAEAETSVNGGTYVAYHATSSAGTWTVPTVVVPPAIEYPVTPGAPTTYLPGGSLAPAHVTFQAKAHQRLAIDLAAPRNVDFPKVYGPLGTVVLSPANCYGSGCTWFSDAFEAPQDGTYELRLPWTDFDTSETRVTVYDVGADATAAIAGESGSASTAALVPGRNADVTFSGEAGKLAELTVSLGTQPVADLNGSGNFDGSAFLLGPDGGVIESKDLTGCDGTCATFARRLPATDTYTVHVDPLGVNAGKVTVTLTQSGEGTPEALARAVPDSLVAAPAAPSRGRDTGPFDANGVWVPGHDALTGQWWSGLPAVPSSVTLPRGVHGETAISGRVLDLHDQPIRRVAVTAGEQRVFTAADGTFLLHHVRPGHQMIVVDGRAAGGYGVFKIGVVAVQGETTPLTQTVWLPKIDPAHTLRLPAPVPAALTLTTPYIPGLEVRIPKGTLVSDSNWRNTPELSITPIPLDRAPFPLPKDVVVPVFFTVQPGDGVITGPGIQIVYPNYTKAAPGTRFDFWSYDPNGVGWTIYGRGEVSADGLHVVPDPGVTVHELTGAMFSIPWFSGLDPAALFKKIVNFALGDPVDTGTGLFHYEHTDIELPDVQPIRLTRTYRQNDAQVRPFGKGTSHPYEMYLWSGNPYQDVDLVLADSSRIHFGRISPGNGATDGTYEHSGAGPFFGARITWNGSGWNLTTRDRTTYVFGPRSDPLREIVDRHGNRTRIVRDASNRITYIRSPHGRWVSFSFNASNRIVGARDNLGRTVAYAYDPNGRLADVTDVGGGVTHYAYNDAHQMTSITDPGGRVVLVNEYDAAGRVFKQTYPDASTQTFTYETAADGRVTATESVDQAGVKTRVTFSSTGLPLTVTEAVATALERTSSTTYLAHSALVDTTTDALGRVTRYDYDESANVVAVTTSYGTADARTTRYTYEPVLHQVASVTDAAGAVTRFEYNRTGDPVRRIDPLGRVWRYAWNGAGQPLTTTEPDGRVTAYSYVNGDPYETTDPAGAKLRSFVDAAGRQAALVDPIRATATFTYDAANRLVSRADALGNTTTLQWDNRSNLVKVTDPRGGETTYGHDVMNRVDTRTDPLLETDHWVYDDRGLVTQETDRRGVVTEWTYDALGRNTVAGYGKNGASFESTVTTTYDTADRVTKVVDTAGGTIDLAWSPRDELVSETTSAGVTSYGYDDVSRVVSRQSPGLAEATYTYDAAGHVTRLAQGPLAVTVAYDTADRPTRVTLPNDVVADYEHDTAGRVSGVVHTRNGDALGDLRNGYDVLGRRATSGGSLGGLAVPPELAAGTYDAANRLTARGGASYTYDDAGNLIGDGGRTLAWDARARLASVVTGGATTTFGYDGLGRRTSVGSAGGSTSFRYDGDTPVAETTGGVTTSLFTGLGTDSYFAQTAGGATQTFLTDALGSTIGLVDASGVVSSGFEYEPYGTSSSSGSGAATRYRFAGREQDATGLVYMRARYYDPALGRFLSEDPLGHEAGDPNLYAYAAGSPTNFVDPSGLVAPLIGACAGGAAWGAAGHLLGSLIGVKDFSWGGLAKAAAVGCVSGVATFGVGKLLGRFRGVADDGAELLGAARVCSVNSFTGDTSVTMADGSKKPIRDVDVGDRVLATDPENGETGARPVAKLIVHRGKHTMVDVRLSDGTVISSTDRHPFWNATTGEFTYAVELEPGDRVRTSDGQLLSIAGTRVYDANIDAYNLSVGDIHTYYAGESSVLVHNSCSDEAASIAEHAIQGGHSIPGVADDALGAYIDDVVASSDSLVRNLARGRTAYWDAVRQTVIIRDPASLHGGSVYHVPNGFDYFLNLT